MANAVRNAGQDYQHAQEHVPNPTIALVRQRKQSNVRSPIASHRHGQRGRSGESVREHVAHLGNVNVAENAQDRDARDNRSKSGDVIERSNVKQTGRRKSKMEMADGITGRAGVDVSPRANRVPVEPKRGGEVARLAGRSAVRKKINSRPIVE